MDLKLRPGVTLLAGMAAFAVLAVVLETEIGLPAKITLRVACAVLCILFILALRPKYPGEQWLRWSLWICVVVNIGLLFTPIIEQPISRGDLMLFALPDAIIVLSARILTYPVTDVHQRAVRQQMILGLVVALAFCGLLVTLFLISPETRHS